MRRNYSIAYSIAALLVAMSMDVVAAVDIPVGVPSPASYWNGLDPLNDARPADPVEWPSAENTNYYYINKDIVGATDTANTYGYPDKPRLTMPTTIAAGKTVRIDGSLYEPSTFTIAASGASNSPVWIVGDSTNRTWFDNSWRVMVSSYLFVENIGWTNLNSGWVDIRPGADSEEAGWLAFRNCKGVGTQATSGNASGFGIGQAGAVAYPHSMIHDVVFYDCEASECGDWDIAPETNNDIHGFGVSSQITNVWWLNCKAFHCGGDGFGNAHGADQTSHNLYWGNCESYECRENAIDLKECHNIVISECTFHTFAPCDSSQGEAIVTHYGPTTDQGTSNVFVFNNVIYGASIGYISTETHGDVFIVGNVIYDCEVGISPDRGGSGDFKIWNNTVSNCAEGILSGGAVDSVDSRNNIVVGSGTSHLEVTDSTVRAASSVSNECYYDITAIIWGSTYTNVASWISGTNVGDNSVEDDPDFTDPTTYDFTLKAGSPCIDAGYDVESGLTNGYYTIFGVELSYTDRAGTTRPMNGTWDIGAYEYDVDTNAPVISSVLATVTGQTTCTVTWTTDETCSTNSVEYSTDESYGDSETATAGTSHTSYLTGLTADTTYNYRVISWDNAGNSTTNTPSTFDTLAPESDPTITRVSVGKGVTWSGGVEIRGN